MGQRIRRVDVAAVSRGMYVADEDDPSLHDNREINKAYDAGDVDWQHVVHAQHKADVSNLTLAYYNGELHQTGWQAGTVWLLCDEGGTPVEQEPEGRD